VATIAPLAIATELPVTTAPLAVTDAPHTTAPIFYARPSGNHGPALAYDLTTGYQLFALPDGLFSADSQHYFALGSGQGHTALDSYSPFTGQLLQSTTLDGDWELSFVTATGRFIALSRQAADNQTTEVSLLDGQTIKEKSHVNLSGNFEVDSVSPDGSALFLIEYLPSQNPDHYQIRLFDLNVNSLMPDVLIDKRFPDEVMAGERWDSVTTPGGLWQLTLYLRMKENEAFIHALNTDGRYTFCIDLPSGGGDLAQQKYNTLAISPTDGTVYVANAVTGTVAEISLADLTVQHITSFTPQTVANPDPQAQLSRSLLSKDGRNLYFTSGQNVWAYDTASRAVTGPFQTQGQISGLGLNPNGTRLLVAKMDGSLTALDTSTGIAVSLR
jgi:WD40 repeat protein